MARSSINMARKLTSYRRICSSDAFATLVVSSAIFTDTFMYDLIIPFMPRMLEDRLGVPSDRTQLWTSVLLCVYGGTFLCANLIVGILIDWAPPSKRIMFLLGILTMTASSLLFFLGSNIAITVIARAVQGVSASLVWVTGFALLTSHVEATNVGWAMGSVSIGMAVGELLGPVVGGVMYEHVGHFAVLGLIFAIMGVDMVLRVMLLEKSPEPEEQQITRPNQEPWTEPALKGLEQLATINFFGLRLNRDLCASCYASFINAIILFAFEASLPNFVSHRFGWTTSASGGIMFAFLSPTALSPVIGSFATRHGPRWATVGVFLVSGAALIGLGFLSSPAKVVEVFYVIAVTVVGICVATITTVHNIAFSVAARRSEEQAKRECNGTGSTGKSWGLLHTSWAVGMIVGPFFADIFLDNLSWLTFCVFLAALSWLSAFVMSFTWREWENPENDK